MVNFIFKWFSKDYCPVITNEPPIINDCILPYKNINLGMFVKGNFYIRKKIYTMSYKNPFFKGFKKTLYSGILHLIKEDHLGWKEESEIILTPRYFENDCEFLNDAYRRYTVTK